MVILRCPTCQADLPLPDLPGGGAWILIKGEPLMAVCSQCMGKLAVHIETATPEEEELMVGVKFVTVDDGGMKHHA